MLYFPLQVPNHFQLKFYTITQDLNVFWTLMASKRRIEQLNFLDWLSSSSFFIARFSVRVAGQ